MFSVLEISDKLLSALGQDILECLFSHKTLSRHYNDGAHKYYQPVLFAMLAVLYVFCHSLVILLSDNHAERGSQFLFKCTFDFTT